MARPAARRLRQLRTSVSSVIYSEISSNNINPERIIGRQVSQKSRLKLQTLYCKNKVKTSINPMLS